MNTKLHAVTDTMGQPIRLFITAGQVSDYSGAKALVSDLPAAECLLGDRGWDADWFRETLVDKGISPCIPGRKSRGKAIKYDKRRNPLRQMSKGIPLRQRPRCNRHIPVMSPEPRRSPQMFRARNALTSA